ncbi:hypothetical protein ACJZ2D_010040 [Fusarium nematophilum]
MIAASHSSVWDYVSLKTMGQVKHFIKYAEGDENEERRSASILEEAKKSTALLAQKKIAEDCLELILDSSDSAFQLMRKLRAPCYSTHAETGISMWMRSWTTVASRPSSKIGSHSTASPDPLYYATLLGYPDIVKLLLASGPSPRAGGRFGQALQLAAFQGKTAIVRELLEEGFDINQADEVLGTPLQAAIAGGQHELANTLMDDYGADVNATGTSFGSALQMALVMHNQGLAASLRNHGAGHEESGCLDRIWDKAWALAQTSGFGIDRAISMLRIATVTDLDLPKGLDHRLEALAVCIYYRHEIVQRPTRVEFSGRLRRREQVQRDNVNEEEVWQTTIKRLRDADVGTAGFLPATFTWLLLAQCRFGTNINMLPGVADTIFKIICQHETFIQTFQEKVPGRSGSGRQCNVDGSAPPGSLRLQRSHNFRT